MAVQKKSETTLVELAQHNQQCFLSYDTISSANAGKVHEYMCGKQFVKSKFEELFDYPCRMYDNFDDHAWFFYARNDSGIVDSFIRVCVNGEHGLPIQRYLSEEIQILERCGLKLGEPGRFAIEKNTLVVKSLLSAIYQLAKLLHIDVYLMEVRDRHVGFYQRNFGAQVLGSGVASPGCTTMAWNIRQTPPRFLRAFGNDQTGLSRFLTSQGAEL